MENDSVTQTAMVDSNAAVELCFSNAIFSMYQFAQCVLTLPVFICAVPCSGRIHPTHEGSTERTQVRGDHSFE